MSALATPPTQVRAECVALLGDCLGLESPQNGHYARHQKGNATMLLHCDLVYVASDAQLILPFVNLGLVPEAGSAWLLPQRIGHVRAFALIALGERLSGVAAVSLGLANAALPVMDLVPAAMAAARTLADKSPSALSATKRLMRDAGAIETAIAADREALLIQLAKPEAAAAFAAFVTRKNASA